MDAPSRDAQGRNRLPLQTCDSCDEESRRLLFRRRPTKMTMSPAASMKRCHNCRSVLCQTHAHASRFDGRVRCRVCHRWHWLYKRVVEPVLARVLYIE
jgi:hypothetical protein